MSNIQITENGSGKYSPEWFYSESQTPESVSYTHLDVYKRQFAYQSICVIIVADFEAIQPFALDQ